jgi:hypothetical protein
MKRNLGLLRIWAVVQMGLLLAVLGEAQTLQWVKPALASLPSDRCCGAMVFDPLMHASLLFGGGNGGISPAVRYNDTWTFSSTGGWSQLSPGTSPSPRQGAGIAYDPTTQTVVLFGGGTGLYTYLNDTWTWDGTTWTQQFPPVSPRACEFDTQGMVYDQATENVVMFMGGNCNPNLAETWVWNGRKKTWTQKFPAASPPASAATIAYDAANGEVVLFGGNMSQTWTWDGTTWTEEFPATSPSPRGLPAMAYDPIVGGVVMFGGSAGAPSALNDTWTWNGSTWTQIQTTYTPEGRWAAAIDFDPYLRSIILFGGELAGDPFANQTLLLVPTK